jgi:hypothetical protein
MIMESLQLVSDVSISPGESLHIFLTDADERQLL